jgi:hypothetical protein
MNGKRFGYGGRNGSLAIDLHVFRAIYMPFILLIVALEQWWRTRLGRIPRLSIAIRLGNSTTAQNALLAQRVYPRSWKSITVPVGRSWQRASIMPA